MEQSIHILTMNTESRGSHLDEQLTIGFFPTDSPQGKDLLEQITALCQNKQLDLEIFPLAHGGQVLWQCRNKDIVIFDASIETEGRSNYAAATGELMLLDHVLIVSRKYLPLNLYGVRPGGYPDYPKAFSNEEIIKWLTEQIKDIQSSGKRPRDLLGLTTWGKSWDLRQQRLNAQGQVFISYRGSEADAVKALTLRIENGDFHQGEKKQAFYFPPGLLSLELMTQQRRWQIVGIIRDYLTAADEVWIYETKSPSYNNSYYNSWWTLAELLTLAYMRNNQKVYLYHPETQSVHKAPDDYLQPLTEQHRGRAARWFANCTPDEMGPEAVMVFRMLQEIPLIKRLDFVKDQVWSEEFWHHPVLDCPRCRTIGQAFNRYNVDNLLFTRSPHFTRFTPDEMRQSLQTGKITCGNPACKTKDHLARKAEYSIVVSDPHYLWIPPGRAGQIAAFMQDTWTAINAFLVSMPTYLIKSFDE